MNQFTPKNINNNPNAVNGNLQVSGDLLVNGDSQIVGDSIVDGNSLTIGNATFSHNLTVSGTLLNVPTGYVRGRTEIPILAKITVPTDENYQVLVTDRILLLTSTTVVSKTITLGDLGTSIFQINIIVVSAAVGDYTLVTTIHGDIVLNAFDLKRTVLHLGNGIWSAV